MYRLTEMPTRIAERVKITFSPEELLKIDNDKLLRAIVAEAAGRETAALLNRIRDYNQAYFDLLDAGAFRDVIGDISSEILEKVIDGQIITQAVAILKEEQKSLRQQAEAGS